MIETVLGVTQREMRNIEVPYEFMRWTSPLIDPYWVGEISEVPVYSEDGSQEFTVMLTGTTKNAWLELVQHCNKIKEHFPKDGGLRIDTPDGAVVFFYSNSFPVPTGDADLKRFQVNLQVKTWKGMI